MKSYSYVCIEGNIGAGKSLLSSKIAKTTGRIPIHEAFEDNSFLPKFYKDQRQFAFPLELSFLAARYNQLKAHLQEPSLFGNTYVADYGLFKNFVFARITLDDDEYNLYKQMYDLINPQLPSPELVIYLHQPVDALLRNIKNRGRSFEMQIDEAYLKKLETGYLDYFKTVRNQRIVIIEAEHLDFMRNAGQYEWLLSLTESDFKAGITTLSPPGHL